MTEHKSFIYNRPPCCGCTHAHTYMLPVLRLCLWVKLHKKYKHWKLSSLFAHLYRSDAETCIHITYIIKSKGKSKSIFFSWTSHMYGHYYSCSRFPWYIRKYENANWKILRLWAENFRVEIAAPVCGFCSTGTNLRVTKTTKVGRSTSTWLRRIETQGQEAVWVLRLLFRV